VWRRLAWLLRNAPLGEHSDRARWMWVAGEQVGGFVGALEARRSRVPRHESAPWT
jgi:hypothetical protein